MNEPSIYGMKIFSCVLCLNVENISPDGAVKALLMVIVARS
jgi:hypothetical protein